MKINCKKEGIENSEDFCIDYASGVTFVYTIIMYLIVLIIPFIDTIFNIDICQTGEIIEVVHPARIELYSTGSNIGCWIFAFMTLIIMIYVYVLQKNTCMKYIECIEEEEDE